VNAMENKVMNVDGYRLSVYYIVVVVVVVTFEVTNLFVIVMNDAIVCCNV
jgi:hypothetical protein